jgi:hypothetical protein
MDISTQIKQDTTTTTTGDIQPLGHTQVEQIGFSSENIAVLTKQPCKMPVVSSVSVGLNHSFLNRPFIYYNGVATIGAAGTVYVTSIFENNFLPPSSFSNMVGTTGYRGTLCFQVVFSAPAQVAGVFKLGIVPLGSFSTDYFYHYTLPLMISQIPQVEVNLAEINSGTLKYPFTFDLDYLRFSPSQVMKYCDLILSAYIAPTGPSTISSVPYTIYQWVEDLELLSEGVATATAIIPQMSKTEFEAVGPISTIMQYASKISTGIGGALPLISHYTRPLSWIFNGVGSIAAHFGWSKPNMATAKTIMAVTGRGYNNCLTVDACQEFGYYGNNEVEPLPGIMGSDIDEMSLCALTCIPSPIARSILLTTDVSGHFSWTTNVSLRKFFFQSNVAGTPWFMADNPLNTTNISVIPTPLYVCASMFSAWRGDLVFRFKFARTKFMSGRFLIGYNAKPDSTNGEVPNLTRYDFHGEVIDLRTTTTYDLVVPFQYYRDFCPTAFGETTYNYNTGSVFLQVIDPLVVPPDGPQSVTYIVEVFSKCGLSFANPTTMYVAPAPAGTAIYAQMDKSDPRKYVSGEAILSLKQLCARLSLRVTPAGILTLSDQDWQTPLPASYLTSWTGATTAFEFFSTAFRLYRGSTILRVFGASSVFWNGISGASNSAVSFESGLLNQVRVPYYGFNKVQRLRAASSMAPVSVDGRYLEIISSTSNSLGVVPGDDFQFAGYVGFPPMVTTNGSFSPVVH